MTSSVCLLALTLGTAPAADLGPTITTTDGVHYTRGTDGHYYRTTQLAAQDAFVSCRCSAGGKCCGTGTTGECVSGGKIGRYYVCPSAFGRPCTVSGEAYFPRPLGSKAQAPAPLVYPFAVPSFGGCPNGRCPNR
jgi:hypothetical protein